MLSIIYEKRVLFIGACKCTKSVSRLRVVCAEKRAGCTVVVKGSRSVSYRCTVFALVGDLDGHVRLVVGIQQVLGTMRCPSMRRWNVINELT